MVGLIARVELQSGTEQYIDDLVSELIPHIISEEPGTLVFMSHVVHREPNARIFYELYRDHDALKEHAAKPYVVHFMSELAARSSQPPRIERLAGGVGKGLIGPGSAADH